MVTFPFRFSIMNSETEISQLRNNIIQCNNSRGETGSLYQESKVRSKTEFIVMIRSEEHRRWKIQTLFRQQEPLSVGSIATCVQRGRIGKVEGRFPWNGNHRNVQKWVDEHKVLIPQFDNSDCFFCSPKTTIFGLQWRCFTQSSVWKLHNQLSHAWREY